MPFDVVVLDWLSHGAAHHLGTSSSDAAMSSAPM